jgi:hypothetical protein
MISTLVWRLVPFGNAALAKASALVSAALIAKERGIGRDADRSLEAVCLFCLLGLTLTLGFSRLAAGY